MTAPLTSVANERVGWFMVVVAAIVAGMGFGALISVTVFLQPLEAEFGWLRAQTSFAYMAGNLTAGVGGIFMGAWADRHGTRLVLLAGTVALAAAYVLLGLTQSLLEFYLFYSLLLCGFAVAAFMVPLVTAIGFWFDKNRGRAISLTMGGQSLGAAVVPYVAGYVIATRGWRDAYLLLALVSWVLLVPMCFLMRDPPRLAELKAATRQHSRDNVNVPTVISPNWLVAVLSLAAQGCCICMTMPLVHLVPLVQGQGFDALSAASVLSVLMMTSFAGRLLFGRILDIIGGIPTLFIASGLQTISVFWFTQVHTLPVLYVFAVIFGLGFGGVFPAYSVIVNELVPAHLSGRSLGIVFFSAFLGMGFGGFLGGWLFDLAGNYVIAFAVAALAGVFNLLIVAGLHVSIRRRRARLTGLRPAA